jgi:hypothetical protein
MKLIKYTHNKAEVIAEFIRADRPAFDKDNLYYLVETDLSQRPDWRQGLKWILATECKVWWLREVAL